MTSLFLLVSTAHAQPDWAAVKVGLAPTVHVANEFDTPFAHPLRNIGWEDGLHISRDGLHLYCVYVPIDILSFILNGELPNNFTANYLRGAPTFGMDLVSNPVGSTEWLHSDILYANRASVNDSFTTWQLANMARPIYTEGAPDALLAPNGNLDILSFTSIDNPTNNQDIWTLRGTSPNPSGIGGPLPAPVNTPETEDNPNMTRLPDSTLVLFFESPDRTGGLGDIDLYVSTSTDDGQTWTEPLNLSTINTASKEHQPFLHLTDSGAVFLYYSAYHTDGKLAIYRARQTQANNWDAWGPRELVVSAGTTAAVGEPSLTAAGDLSFVVAYHDTVNGTMYNQFDIDPWFAPRSRQPDSRALVENPTARTWQVYPNPVSDRLQIYGLPEGQTNEFWILNSIGQIFQTATIQGAGSVPMLDLPAGIYLIQQQGSQEAPYRILKH